MNFVPISWARKHLRSSDAFEVDDTLVGFTSCDDTSYSSLQISRLLLPSHRCSLAAIAAEKSLALVQTQVIKSMLQRKLYISSTIPTSLRHGPLELGRLGLYNLQAEARIKAIKFLNNSLYSNSEAGNLIRLNLQHSQ
jgi:hypothetical protein